MTRARIDASLTTAALDYDLPERFIATRPAEPRDAARLLVMHRKGGDVQHRHMRDLPDLVEPGDLLVYNDTAVAPARLVGRRAGSGGRIEGLFLKETDRGAWRLLIRGGRRLRPGSRIELSGAGDAAGPHALVIESEVGLGEWIARVDPPTPTAEVLDAVGRTPIPPYIQRARAQRDLAIDDTQDRVWYQTVYAEAARRGSVAAPTAGLHFTPALLDAVDDRGARRACVTLHVGIGTFRPITTERLVDHAMHTEWYEVPSETIDALHAARTQGATGTGARVLAIGTTALRSLESLPDDLPRDGTSVIGDTDLFIAPPYTFRHADGMLTNFHLPRSTLLALVGAMVGLDRLLAAYEEAMRHDYRFYSYGDAMLILP